MSSVWSSLLAGLSGVMLAASPCRSETPVPVPAVSGAMHKLEEVVASDSDKLTGIDKTIHSQPELAFNEHKTATVLVREMRKLPITVSR